jgi:hypothetical protein
MANFNEQTAKEFLQRTMTVVGSSAAIEDQNSKFLKRYATVVYSPDAIKIVAPEPTGATGEQGQTGATGEQGQTGATGEQGQTGATGAGLGDGTDAGAGDGTDNQED